MKVSGEGLFLTFTVVGVFGVLIFSLYSVANRDTSRDPTVDQCQRKVLFDQCMKTLPKGPNKTVYNDWAEVVEECNKISTSQSRRFQKLVKPECR